MTTTPLRGTRVLTPEGLGTFVGVTSSRYAIEMDDGRMLGWMPDDVTPDFTPGMLRLGKLLTVRGVR